MLNTNQSIIEMRLSNSLKFYADIFAWFSNGQVKKVSSGDGIYYQACIHPEGTHVVYYGNSSGPPRVWQANLKTGGSLSFHGMGKKLLFPPIGHLVKRLNAWKIWNQEEHHRRTAHQSTFLLRIQTV